MDKIAHFISGMFVFHTSEPCAVPCGKRPTKEKPTTL